MIGITENERIESAASERESGDSTVAVHGRGGGRRTKAGHSLVTPIMQTATYTFENTADLCAFQEAKIWGGDEAMADRRSPAPNFADGVKNQRVLDAIERSSRTRRWVKA